MMRMGSALAMAAVMASQTFAAPMKTQIRVVEDPKELEHKPAV